MPRRSNNRLIMGVGVVFWLLVVVLSGSSGCSLLNRNGPDVTCDDLSNGAVNACEEGIIASCAGDEVRYEVCDEDVGSVEKEKICEASWQRDGAFRCAPSGSGGSGGMVPVGPSNIVISSALVSDDSNADGFASPGEDLTINIFAENLGADPAEGVTASLLSWNDNIILTGCMARGNFGSSQACTSTCDCTNVASSAAQDFNGGQEGSYPVLEVELRLPDDAPLTPLSFDIRFEDAAGKSWMETFEIEVLATGANLQVGSSPLTDDSNDDGQLSPGETATVDIKAENLGTSQVLGLTASLTSWDPNVVLSGCLARGNFGSSQGCTSTCDCTDVPSSSKQELNPGQTGSYSLLEVEFVLAKTAPTTPIVFGVQFEDLWGNTWTDTVTVEVVPTGADIVVDSAIFTENVSGDGLLQVGESGSVAIRAENIGTSRVLDLTARATVTQAGVAMTQCVARGDFGSSNVCVPICDCSNVSSSSKQDISPTQTANYPILEIDFTLNAGPGPVVFTVTFEDDWNNTWVRTVQIPVSP